MTNQRQLSGIREAAALAGSQTKLAEELGVTRQSVQVWIKQGFVPNDRIKKIVELYGIAAVRLCDPALVELLSIKNGDARE
jgi:DNA-binding XRE family transcriptional regulator